MIAWCSRGRALSSAQRPDPEHLIKLFNELMGKVSAPRRGFITFTPKNRLIAETIADFLDKHGIQSGPFFASCFQRYNWRRWPKFHQLASLSNLRAYRDSANEAHTVFRVVANNRASQERPLVPKGLEIVKARLFDLDPEFCKDRPSITGGHNPHSPLCQRCPVSKGCSRG